LTSRFEVTGLKSLALMIGIKQELKTKSAKNNTSRRSKCDFSRDAPEE
jgi:hypothetical protein